MGVYRSVITSFAAGLLLAPLLSTVVAPPAQAAPAAAASPDYDRDGHADLAAVLIGADEAATIRVWYGSGDVQEITHTQLGIAAQGIGWGIGYTLLARDLDGDGYTDLVATSTSESGARVHLIRGTGSGLRPADAVSFPVSSTARSHTTALALVESPVRRLAVGVTTYVKTNPDWLQQEEVRLYPLSAAGSPSGNPIVLKPGSGKLPKLSKNADFGWGLASWGSQLFVAAPEAKVNGKAGAGAVVAVTLDGKGVKSARSITQSTKGVTGTADRHDYFGKAIAARDGYLVVGTPNDHVGKLKDTGSIQVFSLSKGTVKPVKRISQASSGIPGKAERYDRFGSAVAIGTACGGVPAVLVGGPGEVVSTSDSDGAAWLIPLRKAADCKATQLWEGHGLPGKPGTRGIGGLVGFVRDGAGLTDDLVIGGYGSASQGPLSRLFRISGSTGGTLLNEESIFDGIAGR